MKNELQPNELVEWMAFTLLLVKTNACLTARTSQSTRAMQTNQATTQIITTDSDYVRKSNQLIGCGANCQQCKDNVGWVDCLRSDSSKSFYLKQTSGVGTWEAWSSSLDSCLLWSDSSTCTVRDSKVLSSGVVWDDSNCRVWETDKATCNYCKVDYVLSGSTCIK